MKRKRYTRHWWQEILESYVQEIYNLEERLRDQAIRLDDEGLEYLRAAAERTTATNCSWAMFDAAQRMKAIIRVEQNLRSRKAARA